VTIFTWDASNHDWTRGEMNLAAAKASGISAVVHKVCEGNRFYVDTYFGEFIRRARAAGFTTYGGYFVLHPGDYAAQAAWYFQILDQQVPGWRSDPNFVVHMLDAEKFDYMSRAPNAAESQGWCTTVHVGTGYNPLGYVPKWLYGNSFAGTFTWPLVASSYVKGENAPFADLYPGDSSASWGAYSGQTPALLQYTSSAVIGTQSPCDVNAYRGSLDQYRALLGATSIGDDMSAEDTAMLREMQAVLRMIHWTWSPTEQQYKDANGDPKIYAAVGGGTLVPLLGEVRNLLNAERAAAAAGRTADQANAQLLLTAINTLATQGGADSAPAVNAVERESAKIRDLLTQQFAATQAAYAAAKEAEIAGLRAQLAARTLE